MLNSFLFTVIQSSYQSTSDLQSTFEKLKTVDEGERNIKFLLTNELLHRFGLLDSTRSIVARSTPPAPGPQVEMPQVPASPAERTSSEPHEVTVLKKCTGPTEDMGPYERVPLSPIDEEENIPQRPGKELAKSEEKTEEETAAVEGELNIQEVDAEIHQTGHESDDSHIFNNLSDLMFTTSDFFKDHTSQPSLPGTEVSPVVPPLPLDKELASEAQDTTTP